MKVLIIFYLVIAMLFMAYFRSNVSPPIPEDISRRGERYIFEILLVASLLWPVVVAIWIIHIKVSRNRS